MITKMVEYYRENIQREKYEKNKQSYLEYFYNIRRDIDSKDPKKQ